MKNITHVFFLVFGILNGQFLFSQATDFFKSGVIEFERKQNIMATFNYDPSIQNYVNKTGSEIYTSFFTLTLDPDQAIYQFGRNNGLFNQFPEMPADVNTIYHNFRDTKKIVQKNINGKVYSIVEENRKILWKLTEEKKVIAGYECRRANGLIFDSIYVVAFFSEKFIPKIGPESFDGLPGLILGITIPSEHISWFAIKVTPMEIQQKIVPPSVAKEISFTDYQKMVETSFLKIPKFGMTLYKRALL